MANLLTNGDFSSGLSSWSQSPSGVAVVTSGEAVFTGTGSSVRLYQSGFTITNAVAYRLTFRARAATAGLVLGLRLCTNASEGTIIGLDTTQALTTSNVDYAFNFTATATNSNARWRFKLETAGTAYIDNVSIEAVGSIVANFSGTPVNGNAALSVTFTDSSTGSPTGWTWEYSKDGGAWTSFSTSQNPTYNFTSNGVYSIRLTITKAAETTSLTRTAYIVVAAVITAGFTGTPLSGGATLSTTFTDASTATNGISTRTWYYNRNGAGWTQFSTSTNPTYGFTLGGSYDIRLVVTGPDGTNTLDRLAYVSVTGGVIAGFTATPLSGAASLSVTFTDASSGTISTRSWEYRRNGGSWIEFSSSTSPSYSFTLAGTYDIRLTVNGTSTSDTLTRSAYVVVTGSDTILVSMIDTTGALAGSIVSTFAFQPETDYYIVASYDYATGFCTLYVDGTEVASSNIGSHNLAGNESSTINVGQSSGLLPLNGIIDDLVFLNRAITADEVRAVYESNAPVFAETSTWHWRAGRNRLWADTEGLWMVNASGTKVLGAYAGDEADSGATKTWGGVNLSESDVLIGDASRGGYVRWDDSAGTMEVAGKILILAGSDAAKIDFSNITATLDNVTDGTTYKRVTANEKTGAGRAYNGLDASNVLVTKVIPATTIGNPSVAGLYLGSDKMGYHTGNGATSGWKTYMDSSGNMLLLGNASNNYIQWVAASNKLQGVGGGVEQWYADATDGKLKAGAGSVWIDSAGVNLNSAVSFQDSIRVKWWDGANKQFWIGASGLAGTQATLWAENAADDVLMDLLAIVPSTSESATIRLQASQGASSTQWNFTRPAGGAATAIFDSSLTVVGVSTTDDIDLNGNDLVDVGKVTTGAVQGGAGVSMANNAVNALTDLTPITTGFLMVINAFNGVVGTFQLRGGNNTVNEINDPSSVFSHTKDNASTLNVYYDSGYKIQNKMGGTITVYAVGFGV